MRARGALIETVRPLSQDRGRESATEGGNARVRSAGARIGRLINLEGEGGRETWGWENDFLFDQSLEVESNKVGLAVLFSPLMRL